MTSRWPDPDSISTLLYMPEDKRKQSPLCVALSNFFNEHLASNNLTDLAQKLECELTNEGIDNVEWCPLTNQFFLVED